MSSSPESPVVSVVVVSFRAREDVLLCLESLRANVEVAHQVIVVDDGSGDGTVEAVHERHPEAEVLAKTQNEGLVAGRNSALPLVKGRYVLMLDSDTEVKPGSVEALARVLDEQPGVGLVGPKLIYPDGELQLSSRRYPPFLAPITRRGPYARLRPEDTSHQRHLMMDFDHDSERPVVWVAGAAQMWRADLPKRIGGFDPKVSSYGGEDLDWCLRVWEAGLEVRYVPQAEIVHNWRKVTRRKQFGAASWRAFADWYYLQWKHRKLRHDPRLDQAKS
jgi:N-acetylglucosaminyl-diphospho-decaprenol L-rhamnosyltransferase